MNTTHTAMNTLGQLGLRIDNARPKWIDTLKGGEITWHRGRRCEVVDVDRDSYSEPMIIVRFSDGGIGVLRDRELGLRADDIAR